MVRHIRTGDHIMIKAHARCISVALIATLSGVSFGGIQFVGDPGLELIYGVDDLEQTRTLFINVDGFDSHDLEFNILNDFQNGEFYVAGLDSTRNGGFITDFDDNDYGVLRTFEVDDEIGVGLEDGIGYETLSHAGYEYDDFGDVVTGGGLLPGTHYLGFAFGGLVPDPDQPGETMFATLYGWMQVEFGVLKLGTEGPGDDEPEVFVRINGYAWESTGGSILVGEVPSPGSLALLSIGGVFLARRSR